MNINIPVPIDNLPDCPPMTGLLAKCSFSCSTFENLPKPKVNSLPSHLTGKCFTVCLALHKENNYSKRCFMKQHSYKKIRKEKWLYRVVAGHWSFSDHFEKTDNSTGAWLSWYSLLYSLYMYTSMTFKLTCLQTHFKWMTLKSVLIGLCVDIQGLTCNTHDQVDIINVLL